MQYRKSRSLGKKESPTERSSTRCVFSFGLTLATDWKTTERPSEEVRGKLSGNSTAPEVKAAPVCIWWPLYLSSSCTIWKSSPLQIIQKGTYTGPSATAAHASARVLLQAVEPFRTDLCTVAAETQHVFSCNFCYEGSGFSRNVKAEKVKFLAATEQCARGTLTEPWMK